jgi:hypothetical protein
MLHTHTHTHTHTNHLLHDLHQSFGNGFQPRTFLLLCVPELSPYLSRSNSPLIHQLSATIGQVKVKVTLRPTINRPVRHGVRRPFGTRDQFFFLLEIFF